MTCKCGRVIDGDFKRCAICRAIQTERRRQYGRGTQPPRIEQLVEWTPAPWMGRAACRGTATAKFYPERGASSYEPLRKLCAACPVRAECLEDALVYETDPAHAYGFRAGLTVDQRRELQRKRSEQAVA